MNRKLVYFVIIVTILAGLSIAYIELSTKSVWQRPAPAEGYGDINGDGYVTVNFNSISQSDNWLLLAFYDEYGIWDVNEDGMVNDADLAEVALHWEENGAIHWIRADCSADGYVDVNDVLVVNAYWNATKTTPESQERINQIGYIPFTPSDVIYRGDVDGDNTLTINDVILIYQYARGEIDKFPVQGGGIPPVAVLDSYNYTAVAYQPITFDGSASYDTDGEIIAYKWTITTQTGGIVYETSWGDYPTLTYTFENVSHGVIKAYNVKLQVRDDDEMESSTTAMVVVYGASPPWNKPPVVMFLVTPSSATVGQVVTIDASRSYDPEGDDLEFILIINNEYITQWQSSATFTYVFSSTGHYRIEVKARDIYGLIGSSSMGYDVVGETQIKVTVPDKIYVNENMNIIIQSTYKMKWISIDFGDGTNYNTFVYPEATSFNVNHTYYYPGVYSINIEVVDTYSRQYEATKVIYVIEERSNLWWLFAGIPVMLVGIYLWRRKK